MIDVNAKVNEIVAQFNHNSLIVIEPMFLELLFNSLNEFYKNNKFAIDLTILAKDGFKRLFDFLYKNAHSLGKHKELESIMQQALETTIKMDRYNMWIVKFLFNYNLQVKQTHIDQAKSLQRSNAFIALLEKRVGKIDKSPSSPLQQKQNVIHKLHEVSQNSHDFMDAFEKGSKLISEILQSETQSEASSCSTCSTPITDAIPQLNNTTDTRETLSTDDTTIPHSNTTHVSLNLKWKDGSISIKLTHGDIELIDKNGQLVINCNY